MRAGNVVKATGQFETLESRQMFAGSFFVDVQLAGDTPLTLYPIESVPANQSTRISFGVPFARGFVPTGELSKVRVLNAAGNEVAARVTLQTPWRDLNTLTDLNSVRSALVQVDVSFPDADSDGDADPINLTLEWGRSARSLAAPAASDVRAGWVRVDDENYPAVHNVYEPRAFAVFEPAWYGQSLLKTRLEPFGTYSGPDGFFATYDSYFPGFGSTDINYVDTLFSY